VAHLVAPSESRVLSVDSGIRSIIEDGREQFVVYNKLVYNMCFLIPPGGDGCDALLE